jgi:hypothetical protein
MLKKCLAAMAVFLWTQAFYGQAVQDTVYLMNGHAIGQKILDTTLGAVTINNPKKLYERIHYEWNQLYMIRYANGHKRYYYYQDASINNIFTRDEMWLYMKGEHDARRGFTARGALIAAGVFGFIGGASGTFLGPVVPFTFMALNGITKIRIRHETVSKVGFLDSDAYILGYERVSRQKRKIRAVIGGAVGLAVGYGFYALFHNSYPESINFGFNK